jgi:hypothetical protein
MRSCWRPNHRAFENWIDRLVPKYHLRPRRWNSCCYSWISLDLIDLLSNTEASATPRLYDDSSRDHDVETCVSSPPSMPSPDIPKEELLAPLFRLSAGATFVSNPIPADSSSFSMRERLFALEVSIFLSEVAFLHSTQQPPVVAHLFHIPPT